MTADAHERVEAAEGAAARPITILQVLPALNAGGVERGTLEIAQAVVAAGGRALVASAGGRLEGRLKLSGAEAVTMPLASKNPLRIWRNAPELAKLIEREGVDLVHARSRAPAWSAYWASQKAKTHFVTTYHGVYTTNLPLKARYNSVMAKGEAVIAISDFVGRHVAERHGVSGERLVVIPRGADMKAFSREAVSPARVIALTDAWGIADDPRPVLMMPGRLTRWKGQTLFIEACALLRDALGEEAFSALVVGGDATGTDAAPGKFEQELLDMIEAKGLAGCVKLVGHTDDMPAAFRLASFAVSASLEPEAFGRVAVEAQAMGAPVIASAHGGALETVMDGRTGYLFEPGSADALAAALQAALGLDAASRKAMADAAIAHARRSFSVERMQIETLALYERLLGRRFPKSPQPAG